MKTFWKNHQIFGFIFLLLFVLILSTIRIYSASVLTSGAWDLPIFIDGAWRVAQGQVVHNDFSSPVGPVTFLIDALGIKINGPHLQSLSYGVAIIFIFFTVLYYLLSLRVMHQVLGLLSSILIGSFLITPRVLGYYLPTSIGYVGQYNNIGYALFFIIGILLFVQDKRENKPLGLFDGAAIGGITVILLFTKITFAMAAFVLIGYRLLVMHKKNTKEWIIGIFLGLVVFLTMFFKYLDFNFSPFVRDMRMVAFSRSQSLDLFILLKVFYRCLPSILAIGTASYLLFYKILKMHKQERHNYLLILMMIMCCGYFLTISIDQPPEFSVSALCAFYLLSISFNRNAEIPGFQAGDECATVTPLKYRKNIVPRNRFAISGIQSRKFFEFLGKEIFPTCYGAGSSRKETTGFSPWRFISFQTMEDFLLSFKRMQMRKIAFYGLCIIFIGKPISYNLMSNGYALYLKMLPSSDRYSFNVLPLSDALLYKTQFKEFSVTYNDGLELLSAVTLKHEKILSVEYPNLFSFGLERESAVGDLLYWHNGMTFNENVLTRFTYFKPENIFHNVDVVMIPKKHVKVEATRAFLALYNDYLSKHFMKLKESSRWILYRKL